MRRLKVPFSILPLDWSCAAAALGTCWEVQSPPLPSSSSWWDMPERSSPLPAAPSSLCKWSSCLHIWAGLEVSQKPGPRPSPGLVQGIRHFGASIQPIRGSWPFFGTKARLHGPSPPASTAHGFKKLPDSCLWGLLGQPWLHQQFPLAGSITPV